MLSTVLVLVLAQIPPLDATKVKLAMSLTDTTTDSAKELRADPRTAAPALSLVMRAQGPSALSTLFRTTVMCPFANPGGSIDTTATPARAAAALLLELAGKDEAIRLTLAQSGNPLDAIMSVISIWDDETALAALAPRLEVGSVTESERRLISGLNQCGMINGLATPQRRTALKKLISIRPRVTCATAADAPALLEKGTVRQMGWSASNEDITINLDVGTVTADAKPDCVLALYTAQPQPNLLEPLITTDSTFKATALERLDADLGKYTPEQRKVALRLLVARGRRLDLMKEFSEDERRWDAAVLTGALLAKDPNGTRQLLSKLGCPSDGTQVKLLEFVPDQKIAKAEATRLVKLCTDRAGSAAAFILAKQGDFSWLPLLPDLAKNPFGRTELEKALRVKWNPSVQKQLEALKGPDDVTRWRDQFLKTQN